MRGLGSAWRVIRRKECAVRNALLKRAKRPQRNCAAENAYQRPSRRWRRQCLEENIRRRLAPECLLPREVKKILQCPKSIKQRSGLHFEEESNLRKYVRKNPQPCEGGGFRSSVGRRFLLLSRGAHILNSTIGESQRHCAGCDSHQKHAKRSAQRKAECLGLSKDVKNISFRWREFRCRTIYNCAKTFAEKRVFRALALQQRPAKLVNICASRTG